MTASGAGETVSDTSLEKVWLVPDAVFAFLVAPDDGWIYHSKYVEQVREICGL
jgi:hypothetical protein